MHTTIMIGGSRHCCYRQGRGQKGGLYISHRTYRQGRGLKMEKFKSFLRKSANFGKRHILPHLQEIGMNTLLDIMEGKNVKQSLLSNFNSTKNNLVRQQRRRRHRPVNSF